MYSRVIEMSVPSIKCRFVRMSHLEMYEFDFIKILGVMDECRINEFYVIENLSEDKKMIHYNKLHDILKKGIKIYHIENREDNLYISVLKYEDLIRLSIPSLFNIELKDGILYISTHLPDVFHSGLVGNFSKYFEPIKSFNELESVKGWWARKIEKELKPSIMSIP